MDAEKLLKKSRKERTSKEKRRERFLATAVSSEKTRSYMTLLTDICFRSKDASRTLSLIRTLPLPDLYPSLFSLFNFLSKASGELFLKLLKKKIFHEIKPVLFQAGEETSFIINLNHLGEAILGEEEAQSRLDLYLSDLKDPSIPYISIKVSTLYSQINLVAWQETLSILKKRLRTLYRAAGTKLVNLDMEESRDFDLTIALFQEVLDEEEFLNTRGGIVLQSYLPHAFAAQKLLTEWAHKRVARGGSPIRLRIVKGANLPMEHIESSHQNFQLATFDTKVETDANFKRMLEFALRKEHVKAVHIGIGSHNLFDIAYALNLRKEHGVEAEVEFEMLKGMADPLSRVLLKETGSLLLYSPEASEVSLEYALPYLFRRLDENASKENFLHDAFNLDEKSASWQFQKSLFLSSFDRIKDLPEERRRKIPLQFTDQKFHNEPNTDLSLEEKRAWARGIYESWKVKPREEIPLAFTEGSRAFGFDPSIPGKELYTYSKGSLESAKQMLSLSKKQEGDIFAILERAAALFREKRGDLIGAMIADTGKVFEEGDGEVSEAIDFIEYYAKNWKELSKNFSFKGKGIVLVAPPWNFPVSIPVSGIVAALLAGNSVVFKPAPESVLVGWTLVSLFWSAGISKEALSFFPCDDEPVGSFLVKETQAVVLTGATQTAKKLLSIKPGLDLMAETGGKNALIISAISDRDLAIKDLLTSAFSHAGQKCSACSLAILEKEVYNDPYFKKALRDAAKSLPVGSAWNPQTKVPPLIRQPSGDFQKALTLEPGEEWLLEPQCDPSNPNLYSPGIKWGVAPGSFTHLTELFGPILGVMCAETLSHAIDLANQTPYGLTSGLHSLDPREHRLWEKKIIAGNLYINRSITGAIVERQPFGGTKASGFGPGGKAGGPNYVLQLANLKENSLPRERSPVPASVVPLIAAFRFEDEERHLFQKSLESYAFFAKLLKTKTDVSNILGQENLFYHVPLEKIILRVESTDKKIDIARVIAACTIVGTPLEISRFDEENEDDFIKRLKAFTRARFLSPPSEKVVEVAASNLIHLATTPVFSWGRIELLHYMREVSLSYTSHRYGYILNH